MPGSELLPSAELAAAAPAGVAWRPSATPLQASAHSQDRAGLLHEEQRACRVLEKALQAEHQTTPSATL
eukprot:4806902-Alexandrium_andersonii.AAC.1